MYAHVSHYLHLRRQGIPHARAIDHTVQRYGADRAGLLRLLSNAEQTARADADLLEAATLDLMSIADAPTEQMDTVA
jgi:hypothetical protein